MNNIRLRANILQIISIAMVVLLVVITVISLSGTSVSSREMTEVAPGIISLFENERAQESTDRYLKKYYGLNAADYESCVLYFPITNMDAQELLIIKLKDPAQAEQAEAAIRERQKTQIGIYEGYAPEQLSLCENAVIDVWGNYILYVVHEDADHIDEVFRESIK